MHFSTPPSRLISIPAKATFAETQNWSGIVNTPLSGTVYYGALAQYLEPNIGSTSCTPNSVVYWAGIGGFWKKSHTLSQDGTANNTAGLAQNQGWFEILPANITAVKFYATQGGSFHSSHSRIPAQ
jgi:hypothetical protein